MLTVTAVSGSIQVSIFAPKCPISVAGDALKGGFIRPHDLFPVINTPVKISQSKLKTLHPHTWSQESFGGNTSTWYVVVVVVNPFLPAYWGESVSVALWGFAASFSRQSSSRAATPEGSLHKSRADSVVCICGQLKRCCVVCS